MDHKRENRTPLTSKGHGSGYTTTLYGSLAYRLHSKWHDVWVVNKSFIIMGYKCCFAGCTSNYNSAGKEGKCSTFGIPQDPVLRQKWLHHIPREFVNITKKYSSLYQTFTLTLSIQIMTVLHIG